MVEHVPVPEGVTGADFLALIDNLRTLKRGTRRRILQALARGEREKVWIVPVGISDQNRWRMLTRMRRSGWRIDMTSSLQLGTWRWIKTVDVSRTGMKLREVYRHAPLNAKAAYRFNPDFMAAFRAFLGNYRLSGGYIVNRWEKNSVKGPLNKIMASLRISARYTCG